jgi:hypothetical protein
MNIMKTGCGVVKLNGRMTGCKVGHCVRGDVSWVPLH